MANTTPSQQTYLPGNHPDLPPPVSTSGAIGWARNNLFSSPLNIVLIAGLRWMFLKALPAGLSLPTVYKYSFMASILKANAGG